MRLVLVVFLAGPLFAQFTSNVPLVVAPTTVTDRAGRSVAGLTEQDFAVFDNNVPQKIHVDESISPISLVVIVQSDLRAEAILDKLGRTAQLFTDYLAAEGGETALLSVNDEVKLVQDFTGDTARLSHQLRGLRAAGERPPVILPALAEALRLLSAREQTGRRIILVIAERYDVAGDQRLQTLLRDTQLQRSTIYWLTYSAFLSAFTNKPKTVWDRMTDEEKAAPWRLQGKIKYPLPEEQVLVPPDVSTGSLFNIFTELSRRAGTDVADLLTQATGGSVAGFLKQNALENAIHQIADEVHLQYTVTFRPPSDAAGTFHALRIETPTHVDLQVRTRSGYWGVRQ